MQFCFDFVWETHNIQNFPLKITGYLKVENRDEKNLILETLEIADETEYISWDIDKDFKSIHLVVYDPKDNRLVTEFSTNIYHFIPEDIELTERGIREASARGEGTKLEYKEKFHSGKIAKELSAFANAEGGSVLVGVTDEGEIVGTTKEMSKAKDILTQFIDAQLEPKINFSIDRLEVGTDIHVLIITTPQSNNRPIYNRERASIYIRSNATSRPANREEIIDLVNKSSGRTW